MTMTFIDSREAFEAAIRAGVLSADRAAANWAGCFMYMGTDAERGHGFKHIDTRKYTWMRESA